jgi:molybdopterin synthase catalytic subunit
MMHSIDYNKENSKKKRRDPIYMSKKKYIGNKEIDLEGIMRSVKADNVGATAFFVGTVRNFSKMVRNVEGVYYESYVEMAEERMKTIEDQARSKWNIKKVRLLHRIGYLKIGDTSIVIAVSAVHREDAFKACRYIIERIKLHVPIWKKERIKGGKERWMQGTKLKNNL